MSFSVLNFSRKDDLPHKIIQEWDRNDTCEILTGHWPVFSVNPCSFHFSSSSVILKHTSDSPLLGWEFLIQPVHMVEPPCYGVSPASRGQEECHLSFFVCYVESQVATIDGFVLRESLPLSNVYWKENNNKRHTELHNMCVLSHGATLWPHGL